MSPFFKSIITVGSGAAAFAVTSVAPAGSFKHYLAALAAAFVFALTHNYLPHSDAALPQEK